MSFTTDIFKSIIEDVQSKPITDAKSTAMRLIKYDNNLKVAFAIDKRSELKSIYLSVGNTFSKVALATFPKWKGVSIEIVKIPEYRTDDFFVALKELPNSASYIFEIVAEDLRKTIEKLKDSTQSLAVICEILAKWKSFFQNERELLLSDIRQQGLMGELLFLYEAVRKIGACSIDNWAGSNDETHDFYFNDHAIEIKTTTKKEPYYAHISSEYQLDVNDVAGNLYLVFYALRKSRSSGMTLPHMVQLIRELLSENLDMQIQFTEKLNKYGYFDEVSELYTAGYYVRVEYQFIIGKGFPCIVSNMLKEGLSNVEYSVEISHCFDFRTDKRELFIDLIGGMKNAQ